MVHTKNLRVTVVFARVFMLDVVLVCCGSASMSSVVREKSIVTSPEYTYVVEISTFNSVRRVQLSIYFVP